MSDSNLNPLGNIYTSFLTILKNITIKYNGKAEEYETMEIRGNADGYFDALQKRDTFYTYSNYTEEELLAVGIPEDKIFVYQTTPRSIPKEYQQPLLDNRRKSIIENYVEKNNYYRMLNGQPDIEDDEFIYCPEEYGLKYGFDTSIPLHMIQDVYNKESDNRGDYIISCIQDSNFVNEMIDLFPEKKYLNYLGINRIDLYTARKSKNFTILKMKPMKVKSSLLEIFKSTYEQAREYFVKTIYIPTYRNLIDYYDNFIAMSIMIMTVQQICVRQMEYSIRRDFFDIYSVRALYNAYNVPFDINIDEDIQDALVKNLNLLIQNKSTDSVIFNIAYLLGFTDVDIYKYYITKNRKYDIFGAPIIAYKQKFNTDTGFMETVPDYEAMYEIYFSKVNMMDVDQSGDLNNLSNKVNFNEITTDDPFWMEDENLYKRLWETEYNIIESKYLSLGISYSMTELMFDNVVFLKLLMKNKDAFSDVFIQLPKLTSNNPIPIFDVVLLIMSIVSCKHNIYGEIITVPTQVISVLDYIRNTGGDILVDTFKFNFNYFFHPDEKDATNEEFKNMRNTLVNHMKDETKSDGQLVETFMIDTEYFNNMTEEEYNKNVELIKEIFLENNPTTGNDDFERFKEIISNLNMKETDMTSEEKIDTFNMIFNNSKSLYKLISYYLSLEEDKYHYEQLRRIYDGLFYSKEMTDVFTIETNTGVKRTAFTYAECLYYTNPYLYNSVFKVDYQKEYETYVKDNKLNTDTYSFEDFMDDVNNGNIFIYYATLKEDDGDLSKSEKDNILYNTINHVLTRLEMLIKNIDFLYMLGDMTSPLEDLLVKLVRFFKSFTVDIIGLETIYICDFDTENTIRFFDEVNRMEKTDIPREYLNMSYADILDRITTNLNPYEKMSFKDIMLQNGYILFGEDELTKTSVAVKEKFKMTKKINVNEDTQYLVDSIDLENELDQRDKFHLKDEIVKITYED